MRTRVQRWGNSLAIRIPRAYADDLGFTSGSEVDLAVDHDRLVVTASSVPTLDALLAGIDEHNRHPAYDLGSASGNEAW